MPDLVLLAVEMLFGVLFAWALWAAFSQRSVLARDVTLVFTPLAALLGTTFVTQVAEAIGNRDVTLPLWLTVPTILLLTAQPVFSLKLIADLRPLPRWLLPGTLGAVIVTGALLVATLPEPPAAALLAVVGVFVAGQVLAAGYLADEARHRSGGARIRLLLAAASTAAIGVALFVLGAMSAAGTTSELGSALVRWIALAAAAGYWIAFLPPRWLREQWLAGAAFRHAERLLAAPPSATASDLWNDLANTAHDLTGAGSVVLVERDGGLAATAAAGIASDDLPTYGPGALEALIAGDESAPSIAHDLRARSGRDFLVAVPMSRDGRPVGAVCLLRSHASLFDADDAALVSRLAARSAYLVQRREALAEEQRLTEQLRLTVEALEAAGAAKSDFLASMSHELRTPLNAIIGFSELMVADDPESDMVTVPREWIDHIRNGGAHLVGLINDVLDLAKIEAGRLELVRVPVDVGLAVAESVAGLRPLADRKKQTIRVSAASQLIEADPGRLRQILYNLLSNAIKYTGEGGQIQVDAARVDGEIHIAVRDSGVGISAEDQLRVFEEFRQVGDPTARQAGTGLGLALTKRLLQAHDGRIHLRSAPGEGSTFTAVLPVGRPATGSASPAQEPDGRERDGATVLIIEDDPSSVRLLQTYLADSGYQVAVAADGETGLRMAVEDPPVAILLDILLPRIDGWEVLRRLKSEPTVRDVPVVIVTVVDERNVGLALGAVDYFVKPIEREALLARLARHTFLAKVRTRPVGIVAIDDDPAALDMIDATLSPYGFAIHRAGSGQLGLDLAAAVRPDLVICDLLMPGLDGFEVVRRLHEDPATSTIPILVLTAHGLTEAEKARLNGQILGVVDKGDSAALRLREWLARVLPDIAKAPVE